MKWDSLRGDRTARILLAIGLCCCPATSVAQSADVSTLAAQLDSIARTAVQDGPIAGLSVGVVRDADTILVRGYGYADLENRVPATPQTVYRIGSLTKQFTALATLQLVEQGKIDLDEEITEYLPGFDTQGHRVTVRHLLTHTSGIKSYTSLGDEWLSTIRLDLTRNEVVSLFEDEPFEFDPGDQYAYGNSGYFLLGMIIESVSGQPYREYLHQQLFRPLELQDTHYCDARTLIPGRAEGYARAGEQFVNDEPVSMTQPFAAGGLCSSVVDLLKWQRALHEHHLIPSSSYRQMVTPATLNDGSRTAYGFGLGVTQLDGHTIVAHGGGQYGFSSYAAHLPADHLTVVILANTENSKPWDIARDMIRVILGTTPAPVTEHPLSGEDRRRYSGYYDLGDLQLRVFERDGRLMAQATGQPAFDLLYQGDHEFVAGFDHAVRIEFEVRGNVSVGLMLRQGGRTVRGVRIPEWP